MLADRLADFAGQHPTTFLTKELTRRGCMDWGFEKEQYNEGEEQYILSAILIHEHVFEYALGDSVKSAKSKSSTMALEKLDQMTDEEFQKFCNCRKTDLEGVDGVETIEVTEQVTDGALV